MIADILTDVYDEKEEGEREADATDRSFYFIFIFFRNIPFNHVGLPRYKLLFFFFKETGECHGVLRWRWTPCGKKKKKKKRFDRKHTKNINIFGSIILIRIF